MTTNQKREAERARLELAIVGLFLGSELTASEEALVLSRLLTRRLERSARGPR